MKCALFSICLFLSFISIAQAHEQPPITRYVQFSSTVCVAKATEVKKEVVTFTVEEIIKGKPPTILILDVVEVPEAIALNSEWLLAATGKNQDTLGWALKGDHGWVNAPIERVDGKIHLVGNYGLVDPSLAADVSKGLTMEKLKELANKPIAKN